MTAPRLSQEPISASSGERIARLVVELARDGLGAQAVLDGVRLVNAASWNGRESGLPACILVQCARARPTRHANDDPARFQPCYRVQAPLAPFEPPAWEAGGGPATCLSVQLDLQVAAELILALDDMHPHAPDADTTPAWIPLDEGMGDAVLRLLRALRSPADARVLGAGIVREILYRVLITPRGAAVRAILGHQASLKRIGKALRRIRASYADALDVAALAGEAGMSIAAFHTHFKAVTHTSPIQFLKTTRLQQARLLMMREGVSAACASRQVGYESNSQFSREFKRLFGRTPAQEALRMKAALRAGVMDPASHSILPPACRDFPPPASVRSYLS